MLCPGGVVLSCYGFDLLSLMAHSVDHLFIFLWDRCLIRSLPIYNWVICLLSLKVFLYSPNASP